MENVILSRKGFDSSWGGYPSPILPDGTLLSLPIPDRKADVRYANLKVNENLSYLELMKQLGIESLQVGNQKIELTGEATAHLDPDIVCSVTERSSAWKPIFGQDGIASTHLDKNGVDKGSIFLFFGWFRRTILRADGSYQYDPADKEGRHIIYGYMEVDQKIKIQTNVDYSNAYMEHPHFKYRDSIAVDNTAYIAADFLTFDNSINGVGTFKYNDSLVLSKGNKNRSIWKLPSSFHPDSGTKMTYHEKKNKWKIDGNYCTLQSANIGQEFIVTGNSIYDWAKSLIIDNTGNPSTKETTACNHLNYPNENGLIYCRNLNTVTFLDFDTMPCTKDCPLLNGSLQGSGVECQYVDGNANSYIQPIYDPYKQYFLMNKAK